MDEIYHDFFNVNIQINNDGGRTKSLLECDANFKEYLKVNDNMRKAFLFDLLEELNKAIVMNGTKDVK